jgi:hypothetical protein
MRNVMEIDQKIALLFGNDLGRGTLAYPDRADVAVDLGAGNRRIPLGEGDGLLSGL